MPSPLVFVLVLNYNSFDDTVECVAHLRKNAYPNYRLLVIDNASPDGSGARLAGVIPSIELLLLSRNTGYAGGNNTGITLALEAGARYVLILNPDIRLAEDAVGEYVRLMEGHGDIGILSPLQLSREGGPIDAKFEQSVLRRHDYDGATLMNAGKDALIEVSLVLGASMMIRADTFRTIGGFDPLFFAYGEEEDLCRRTISRGIRIAVTGAAPVIHLRTKEQGTVSDRVLFLRTKGAYLLRMKDPAIPFPRLAPRILAQATVDLLRLARNRYPFSHYAVARRHVLFAWLWLLVHLPKICLHRRRERFPGAHLMSRTQAHTRQP